MRQNSKIKCLKCGDIIESMDRHDFKHCKCGSVFVDGGNSYLRFGWPSGPVEDWVEVLGDPDAVETATKCTCSHIPELMECYRCGYPYNEAAGKDDGTPCGCKKCQPIT